MSLDRSYFKGKFFIKLQSSSCTGDLYLRRGLGFDTAEVSDLIEYGPADPELYKKVKALEKLVEQAAGGARPAPLAVEEDKPATKGDTKIAEIVANPNAPFDGEWKGKFVAESGETPEHGGPQVCLFRETYFNATVKDNQFLAVIDQKGDKRKFEGAIEKDGKLYQ